MAELLRAKNHEKNKFYDEGYKKGMEDAVKQGYAHIVNVDKTDDILRMLAVIHDENLCILGNQFATDKKVSEIIKRYDDVFYGREPDSE